MSMVWDKEDYLRSVLKTMPNIYDRAFCKISERLQAVNYFRKKAPSQIFDKVLNMPLYLKKFKNQFQDGKTDILIYYSTDENCQVLS